MNYNVANTEERANFNYPSSMSYFYAPEGTPPKKQAADRTSQTHVGLSKKKRLKDKERAQFLGARKGWSFSAFFMILLYDQGPCIPVLGAISQFPKWKCRWARYRAEWYAGTVKLSSN
jgi:hypothetical protein